MNVSIFHDMTSKLPLPGLLEGVANLIRTDEKLAVFTQSYRQTGCKSFKNESQLFSVACLFEGGKGRSNVKHLTGMSLVDFDHAIGSEERRVKSEELGRPLTDKEWEAIIAKELNLLKEKIMADPHTLMCYITMSGNGLRVIFMYEVPPEIAQLSLEENSSTKSTLNTQHLTLIESYYQQAFYAGNAYYEKLLGLKADMQCKNLTRLSGLAHDPEVFLRAESEIVRFTAEEITSAASAYAKQSKEDKQLQRIQTYFDTLIAPQLAKDNIVFQGGSHNEYVMRVGYHLAERRFSKKIVMKWALQKFGKDYPDTEQVITSCFNNASAKGGGANGGKGSGKSESKFASVEEIKFFLDGHVRLRMNEITSRVEYELSEKTWTPINDRKVNSLWAEMSQVTRVNKQDMYSIIESDYVPTFNPFEEYLNHLPEWHEGDPDYIVELAATIKVKGEPPAEKQMDYLSLRSANDDSSLFTFRSSLKKWLVAMVASWLSDDVVNNVILVLIGEQGAYKTTWFNYLLPPELKQYFYTKTNANRMSKDDLLTLAQYALVCCEELDTMRPAELNQLKAAVTMPSIDERAAYAHYHEHRKHIASFCGTGNNTQFLSDPTGNRRWLPFEVESIVNPREHPFNYEGIYSQALALYKRGFQYWFTKEEIQELNHHNKQFETPHLERELVSLYFRTPHEGENGIFMTSARAIQLIGTGISQKLNPTRVGLSFNELGFQRVRYHGIRGYLVIQRTAEEMQAYQKGIILSQDSEDDDLPF